MLFFLFISDPQKINYFFTYKNILFLLDISPAVPCINDKVCSAFGELTACTAPRTQVEQILQNKTPHSLCLTFMRKDVLMLL